MTQFCLMKYKGKIAGRASKKCFLASKCTKENIGFFFFYHMLTFDIEI